MVFNNPYGAYVYPYSYMQHSQQQPSLAYVNGIEGAKAFTLQPNGKIYLIDSDNPVIYCKESDAQGKTLLRGFSLTEIDLNSSNNPSLDTSMFATKDDLAKAVADINRTLTELRGGQDNG